MFSALRQGSQFYILEKGNNPSLKIGVVQSITSPTMQLYNNTVDINVKVGDEFLDFKQLPATLSIANYGNTVVSENKELMCNEVESAIKSSKDIIESIPYHEKIIEKGEEMLKQLNPQFAKQKDQEIKINNLEQKVESVESKLDSITSMLEKALKK